MSHNQEEKHTLTRREALKTLAAITGAVSLASLPNKWESPLVEVGALPAHAQSSTTAAIRANNVGSFPVAVVLNWPDGSFDNRIIDPNESYTWSGLTPINVTVTGAASNVPCYYLTWGCASGETPAGVDAQNGGDEELICDLPAGSTKQVDVDCEIDD
jgi:hypothetical protein